MNAHSPPRFTRRRRAEGALAVYSVRISLGLIASLLVVIGLTRLPLHEPANRVGWGWAASGERIQLSDLRTAVEEDAAQERSSAASEVPVTLQAARNNRPDDAEAASSDAPPEDVPAEAEPTERRALQLAALGPAGQAPQIAGGRGSLYLRIHYPEEARRQGIQGRVVLDFVVDTDGVTHDVRVVRSLHPLCDSSAVAAIELTRFVPARRNGEKVAVRMR